MIRINKFICLIFFMICYCYLAAQNLNVKQLNEFLIAENYQIYYSQKKIPKKVRRTLKICDTKIKVSEYKDGLSIYNPYRFLYALNKNNTWILVIQSFESYGAGTYVFGYDLKNNNKYILSLPTIHVENTDLLKSVLIDDSVYEVTCD